MQVKKVLTRLESTNSIRTVLQRPKRVDVDPTAKKLVERLNELEDERFRVNQEIRSIMTALHIAGVRPEKLAGSLDDKAGEYHGRQSFANTTLGDACQQILQDLKDQWLTKSQIEYLIARGGYQFSTKDSKNSVAVTLQRLAENGKCDVERVRGSRGNRYRWISRFPREKQEPKS